MIEDEEYFDTYKSIHDVLLPYKFLDAINVEETDLSLYLLEPQQHTVTLTKNTKKITM